MAKEFPDLTGDGKVTQADVLKGRGVFSKGSEVEEKQKQYIRDLLASQMISQMPDETEAEAKARQERIQQELDIEQKINESLFMEVIKEDRKDMAMGGSLMMPPEREQASRGLKVLAKKLMAGAKKVDKKLESKLDEMQGLDDTVIGVSSKTGRPKFATPGETAPEKGAIVGKDRVKIRDTSKTVKGGIYGTGVGALGAAGVAGLLELFDGNEAAMISYAEANDDLPSSSEASDFEKAFSAAFKAGEDTFEFKGKTYTTELKRGEKADGGSMAIMMPVEYEEPPKDTYNNISSKEDKEQVENMNSDGEMEEEYLDYVADEVLSQEEQDYLFKALDEDNRLEEILDKVMLNATEFTGAGEVDGPGTGVSDSIPARLSDGEFVFTRKATDQIGADKLQKMMDDAEREFDQRKGKANGGQAGTNPFVNPEEMSNPLDRFEMDKDDERDIERQMLYSSRMPSLMNR
jgi:hypothetical protein